MKEIDMFKDIPKIFQTTDYGIFILSDRNRSINERNLKILKPKIKKTGGIKYPIIVRPADVCGKYEIMDGQHRFLICKELGFPIKYMIDKDMTYRSALELNSTGSHNKMIDILHVGGFQNESCRIAEEILIEFSNGKISPEVILYALWSKMPTSVNIIDKLHINSKEIPEAKRCLSFISSITCEKPRGRRRDLYFPIIDILKDNPEIDIKRMRRILVEKTIPNNKEISIDGWAKAIDRDYNRGLSKNKQIDIFVNYMITHNSRK